MSLSEPVKRPKLLTELAVDKIRSAIVSGDLDLGQQISESALATSLGISKTPVREALLHLRLEGLVDIYPQSGSFVFRLKPAEVIEVCEFREIVEAAALPLAMERNRAELVKRLEANVESMGRAERKHDVQEKHRLDTEFHNAFLDLCGNPHMRSAYRLVSFKIQALRAHLPDDDKQVNDCEYNHALIVKKISGGSVAQAVETLRSHIRSTQDSYLAASVRLAA